jgi:hypothetical protein
MAGLDGVFARARERLLGEGVPRSSGCHCVVGSGVCGRHDSGPHGRASWIRAVRNCRKTTGHPSWGSSDSVRYPTRGFRRLGTTALHHAKRVMRAPGNRQGAPCGACKKGQTDWVLHERLQRWGGTLRDHGNPPEAEDPLIARGGSPGEGIPTQPDPKPRQGRPLDSASRQVERVAHGSSRARTERTAPQTKGLDNGSKLY